MNNRILLLALLAGFVLPASAAERIRVVEEGGIRDEWTATPGAQFASPGYPAEYAAHPDDVCVSVGYLLNPDGHTSDFALLKSWSTSDQPGSSTDYWRAFATAASQALAQWHFVPRPEVKSPRPVYTVATFIFGAAANVAATREHCKIPDLSQRLLELQYDSRAGRRMSHGIFSRLDIDPDMGQRLEWDRAYQRESNAQRQPKLPPPPPPPNPPSSSH